MNIYLVRHGQSTNNAGGPRVADPPLTETGRAQADCAGKALKTEEIGAKALYVSPMRRALETARALQEALTLPMRVLPELCETSGVSGEPGLCRTDILREYPNAILDARITESGWWTPNPEQEPEAHVY